MGNSQSTSDDQNQGIQKGLQIVGDNNLPQDLKREPFERLRNHFCPVTNLSQTYADELARLFALRFSKWDSPARPESAQLQLANRIRGCIFGMALGDAVGLATEFLSKEQVQGHYTKEQDWSPGQKEVFCDTHRMTFPRGDWTDDTDQAIVLLNSLLETGGKADVHNFAEKLHTWMEEGFRGLGDESGAGLGKTTGSVLRDPDFKKDPLGAAEKIWRRRGCKVASNGAVMRTAACGIPFFWDPEQVRDNTVSFCKVTHADPRCAASCVAVTAIVSRLLCLTESGEEGSGVLGGVEGLIALGVEEGKGLLGNDPELLEEYTLFAEKGSLEGLDLAEPHSIGHTFKALFSGVLTLRQGAASGSFEKEIIELVMCGGDADTNGAVGGALLGCWLGYDQLPDGWLKKLPYFMWLEGWVQKLLFMLGLPVKISEVVGKEKEGEEEKKEKVEKGKEKEEEHSSK